MSKDELGYSIPLRIPNEVRENAVILAAKRKNRTGKHATQADILRDCIVKGMAIVDKEEETGKVSGTTFVVTGPEVQNVIVDALIRSLQTIRDEKVLQPSAV